MKKITYPFEWLDENDLKFKNHPIQIIDFIANGIISNYSGVLGMDILKQRNLCFHFEKKVLTFS